MLLIRNTGKFYSVVFVMAELFGTPLSVQIDRAKEGWLDYLGVGT